jgi:hypothetical protein
MNPQAQTIITDMRIRWRRLGPMQELPTRDEFASCLHEKFRLHRGSTETLELELIEVAAGRGATAANGRPFALLFRGPPVPVLPQMTYALEHERLGILSIFLVPVGKDAAGVQYESVFN